MSRGLLLSLPLLLALTVSTHAPRLVRGVFGGASNSASNTQLYAGQAAAPDVAGVGTWNGYNRCYSNGFLDS